MKKEKLVILGATLAVAILMVSPWARGQQVTSLKFGTAVRAPAFDMPFLAAQEQGLWKRNGLEVEWISFTGGGATYQAMAAQSVQMAMSDVVSFVVAASSGVPAIMVADPQTSDYWHIWVRGDGAIREPKGLKGARIGTLRIGGASSAFARLLVKGAGLSEREVKFIAVGGGRVRAAALMSGAVDAYVAATLSEMPLKAKGEIRSLISLKGLLPKEWATHILSSDKSLVANKPDVVRRAVQAFFQAAELVQQNRDWTIEKLQTFSKYPEPAAKEAFNLMAYGKDGRINRKALENIRAFLIEYGLLSPERALPVEALFTEQFTR